MEAKAQQGSCLDPLAPAGRSELTSSLSGSPCLEQSLALMHFESLNVELLRSSKIDRYSNKKGAFSFAERYLWNMLVH